MVWLSELSVLVNENEDMDSEASCLCVCVLKESDSVHIPEEEFCCESDSSGILGCDGYNEK
jgi:hypothetical protein